MNRNKGSSFAIVVITVVLIVLKAGLLGFRNAVEHHFLVAKQAQAKIALIKAYDAQMVYFKKNKRFSDDWVELGFCDLKDQKLLCGLPRKGAYYKIGFVKGQSQNRDVDGVIALAGEQAKPFEFDAEAQKIAFSEQEKLCADCVASAEAFKVLAVGNIDRDAGLDVWTVDQTKKIIHLADDAAEVLK